MRQRRRQGLIAEEIRESALDHLYQRSSNVIDARVGDHHTRRENRRCAELEARKNEQALEPGGSQGGHPLMGQDTLAYDIRRRDVGEQGDDDRSIRSNVQDRDVITFLKRRDGLFHRQFGLAFQYLPDKAPQIVAHESSPGRNGPF
eukprot:Opistho-2@19571